ncbi:MAG: phosphoribosylamine--glycine ligase [Bacteroidota bacterium]
MKAHNILLLGSGGREHALAWKLTQSPLCKALYIAPGNAGTAQLGTNIAVALSDFEALKKICIEKEITLLFPGSEEALVLGVWDYFKQDPDLAHIIVAGPSKAGAQLEGSKAFSKKFMQRHQIPTAAYAEFSEHNYEEGLQYLAQHALPIVLKADGLAAGKGVVIAFSHEEAFLAFEQMIKEAQFGAASKTVVVEAFLTGIELSVFALSDGTHYVLLPEAKDYKRIGEGDKGLNTGGMGAISPVPFADAAFMQKVKDLILEPTIKGLSAEGITYQGFIFFGLINVGGEPFVIEYNCRMGDPETEVVMLRLENDLVALLEAMQAQQLDQVHVQCHPKAACTVMLVSGGYPEAFEKGFEIKGLQAPTQSLLFHAGTKMAEDKVLTNGGRVIAVSSYGTTLKEALQGSYDTITQLDFQHMNYRKDIGWEF